jgi:hypothetical protein
MNAPEKLKQFDRDAHAVGNIVHLEHFNVCIPDQRLATLFYVVGLGGTRDPYLFMGLENMWVNFGRTQVHLPSRAVPPRTEVLRGTVGFVVPSLEDLLWRLEFAKSEMKRVAPEIPNKFSFQKKGNVVEATCPWGNRVRCHAPSPQFGSTELGLVYVDFDVPQGTADGIARFYREVMKAPSRMEKSRATVSIGKSQYLHFTETEEPLPEYDNHHIQVYIADFGSPYHWLKDRPDHDGDGRLRVALPAIVDPRDHRKLFRSSTTRSMKHRPSTGHRQPPRHHNMTYGA